MNIWITGSSRTGKTSLLVKNFALAVKSYQIQANNQTKTITPAILVLAANNDNRQELSNKLIGSIKGTYPVICKTTIGFLSDEVILFWPLLFEQLNLKAQFPLLLRPETEQELARSLWRPILKKQEINLDSGESRFVRRTLDLLQLAGASGTRTEDLPMLLENAFPADSETNQDWEFIGKLLTIWKEWCLARGLLTYGIIYELYGRYLLHLKTYQEHLRRRIKAIFADDMDDYPAIARDLAEILIKQGAQGVFTFNVDGQVRKGLNADPDYIQGLAAKCKIEQLQGKRGLASVIGDEVIDLITNLSTNVQLGMQIQSIQTISRAQLLRTTAEIIKEALKNNEINPSDIAIIAPGLDEIGRYSLIEILTRQGIAVNPLNEQRALITYPIVRSLLTLLTLIYPGLGDLSEAEEIAEMLVILTRKPKKIEEIENLGGEIDLVRGRLIADYCYARAVEEPKLLATENYARWDRLSDKVRSTYENIRQWIEETKTKLKKNYINPVIVLDSAIKKFFPSNSLPMDQLSALKELTETTQHFWEVQRRLKENEPTTSSNSKILEQFINLLRAGTITANARPGFSFSKNESAITLATIYQYRAARSVHRWQFWLDASNNLWDKGGASSLFAAPIFLRDRDKKPWTPSEEMIFDEEAKLRIIKDLLSRCSEKVFLCHSDLGINGAEQSGSLSALVYGSDEFSTSAAKLSSG